MLPTNVTLHVLLQKNVTLHVMLHKKVTSHGMLQKNVTSHVMLQKKKIDASLINISINCNFVRHVTKYCVTKICNISCNGT